MDRFVFKFSLITTLFKDFFNKHYILIVLSSVLSTGKRRCLMPSFGHLMRRTDSFEKTLMLGKIEGKGEEGSRGWDGWMASPTQWTWIWANSKRQWRMGEPDILQPMRSQRIRHDLVTEQWQVSLHLVAVNLLARWKWKCLSLSRARLCNSMDCSPPAPLSMKFSRQEYWSGLPCPSPVDLPNPRIKSVFPELQTDCLAS